MLFRIALRNLWLHKFKTVVVGSILFVGTALLVIGNSVLDTLDRTMAISLINSVTGHIQIYSADAKDEFEIFRTDSATPNIGRIDDFARVKETLEKLDAVETVVPMGIDYAVVFTGNILDRRLSELREALNAENREQAQILITHIRRIVETLDKELENLEQVADMERLMQESAREYEDLAKTRSDAFWARFSEAPYEVLEFLENKVAKLAFGEDLLWLSYIGTDTEAFEKTFDRFEIVDGERIPPGKRGFLFNKLFYERNVKNKTARRLDEIKEIVDQGDLIAECDDCATATKQNVSQAASLAYQLDEASANEVRRKLQQGLGSQETDITKLIQELVQVDDANFAQRYQLFYDVVAPKIGLYTIAIGDTLVLTAFSRGGYVRKVPVKVYGTYQFKSLDKSPVAGAFSITDLMTFRELYGYMTAEKLKELEEIREEVGIEHVAREDAEAELFGGGDDDALVEEGTSETFDATAGVDMTAGGENYTEQLNERVYSKDEINDGVVLNAAVMLKPGADPEEAQAAIDKVAAEEKLGIQTSSWRAVSGIVGDFIGVIRAVLYAAVFIIFMVALVIINNSMMMSTMERTVELGTMRAMGAQRGLVLRMIFLETGVLALLFGGAGAIVATALMLYWQSYGIPAWSDVTTFMFAGPRLYPDLTIMHLLVAVAIIGLVSILSTVWPAVRAAYITPRAAMAKE